MMKSIAVKELAYFVCQSGNLTTEFFSNADLERGKRAHLHIQEKYNSKSQSEVYIKKELSYLGKSYLLHGFIDGVLNIDDEIIIEEIKSTTKELDEITIEYHKEHLAQLKIYGYLYALNNQMETIHLRLTYISVVDYLTNSFDIICDINELEEFTFSVLEEYINFLNLIEESEANKDLTIKEIKFPFANERPGQRDLMKAVFQAMNQNEILYAIAPTGIGKTMATMFSTLKTLKRNDKLFYTTAKGSGKNAPLDAIKLLAKNGLKIKTIDITAKRKICNQGLNHCNPDDCPFAQGYFDKLKMATLDIFKNHDIYDRELILEVANKHKICAFEFSLYLSYYCDIVISDYNYVFDPKAHLIRYFEDDTYKPKVLVDEAHNLISRSKDMYSCQICEDDIRLLRSRLNGLKPSIRSDCNKALEIINKYREVLALKALYCDTSPNLDLNSILKQLSNKCEQIFEENKNIKNKDEIMEIYFKLLEFNRISDYFSISHRHLARLINDSVYIEYFCLDASEFLLETIKSSIHGIVFFSATLYPITYHSNLLTKGEGKYLELKSPFDEGNLDIIINNKISTKYNDRENSIDTIIETIEILTEANPGNYIIFFPSYQYMNMVVSQIDEPNYEMIIQESSMSDMEKNQIIDKFKTTTNTKVGFFVMGGVFSEGIDYIGNALNGVIVVGVGLPMVCDENNILKDFFDEEYHQGFEYAYMYPGFTKVIQAVGRVIRSESDRGVAILIDERFTHNRYLNLMPPHWTNKKCLTNSYDLMKELKAFYNK
ncbi:MAG: ATP-dependent DNA helicase [Erysipelotrichaceae bacterium]|nr:ATP-dependent DNA helicase [Erysipelotrichaceae bacterium]